MKKQLATAATQQAIVSTTQEDIQECIWNEQAEQAIKEILSKR